MDGIYEKQVYSPAEWAVFLTAAEIHSFYGFPAGQENPTKEEILPALRHLSERGILSSDGVRFSLGEEAGQMAEHLRRPRRILVIYARDAVIPVCCCYRRERLLLCERGNTDRSIKLAFLDETQWKLVLEEEFLDTIPEISGETDEWAGTGPELSSREEGILDLPLWSCMNREDVLFLGHWFRPGEESRPGRILVREQPLVLTVESKMPDGTRKRYPYRKKELRDQMLSVLADKIQTGGVL